MSASNALLTNSCVNRVWILTTSSFMAESKRSRGVWNAFKNNFFDFLKKKMNSGSTVTTLNSPMFMNWIKCENMYQMEIAFLRTDFFRVHNWNMDWVANIDWAWAWARLGPVGEKVTNSLMVSAFRIFFCIFDLKPFQAHKLVQPKSCAFKIQLWLYVSRPKPHIKILKFRQENSWFICF